MSKRKRKKGYVTGNKALWSMYDRLNKTYFGGNLPFPMVLKFVKMKQDGHTIYMTSGAVHVFVHKDLKGHLDEAEIVLLHEMIHVFLGFDYKGSHGMRFEAEKVRLFMAGAYDKIL
jgi:hypothetical protein